MISSCCLATLCLNSQPVRSWDSHSCPRFRTVSSPRLIPQVVLVAPAHTHDWGSRTLVDTWVVNRLILSLAVYLRRVDVILRGFSGYNTRLAIDVLPHFMPSPDQAQVRALVRVSTPPNVFPLS